jgi:flagellar motor switch protein FliN/FliY
MEPPSAPSRGATLEWLSQNWGASLARALEAMTGESPVLEWSPDPATSASTGGEPILWWEQEFDLVAEPSLWIGLAERTWMLVGGRALRAAGVEEVQAAEARSTALEIVSQAFSAMAQALGDRLERAENAAGGREAPGAAPEAALRRASLRFHDTEAAPLLVAFSPRLAGALETPAAPSTAVAAAAAAPAASERQMQAFKTLDLLRDVELPVSVSFGRTRMPLEDVLKLTAGSVIELDRSISEPVSLIVNDTVVALGEVVVIEGNYGLRIQQIMSRESLLRSSGVA